MAATILAEDGQEALVTEFSFGVLLARVRSSCSKRCKLRCCHGLSSLAAQGAFVEFRSGLRRLLLLVGAVGIVGTLGAFVLGPWVVELVYDADLTGRTMAALALGSAFYMVALALAQASSRSTATPSWPLAGSSPSSPSSS